MGRKDSIARTEGRTSLAPRASRAEPAGGVRLQKVIAEAGLASRRKAETMIVEGRVTVNGRVVRELGTRVNQERDHIKVDGRHLKPAQPQTFVMLHKPPGVVSTMSDPEGRPTIGNLLHGIGPRVFPVGRLDFDSEGLILLTNHGDLAQALLHPRYHVPKTYRIKVKGVLSEEEMQTLRQGVKLDDGPTGKAIVQKVRKAEKNSWIDLTIFEGRKHQVKRMLEATGHSVLKLIRIQFGPLCLGDLPACRYRYLTDREANALRSIVREREAREAGNGQWAMGNRRKKAHPTLSGPTDSLAPRTSRPARRRRR